MKELIASYNSVTYRTQFCCIGEDSPQVSHKTRIFLRTSTRLNKLCSCAESENLRDNVDCGVISTGEIVSTYWKCLTHSGLRSKWANQMNFKSTCWR